MGDVAEHEEPLLAVAGVGRVDDVEGDGAPGAPVANAPTVAGAEGVAVGLGAGVAPSALAVAPVAVEVPAFLLLAGQVGAAVHLDVGRGRLLAVAQLNKREFAAGAEVV